MSAAPSAPAPFTRSVLRQIVTDAPRVSAIVIARQLNWSADHLRRVCRVHGIALLDEASLDALTHPDGGPERRSARNETLPPDAPLSRKRSGDNTALIAVYVPPALSEVLRTAARRRGVTLSVFLRDYLAREFGDRA